MSSGGSPTEMPIPYHRPSSSHGSNASLTMLMPLRYFQMMHFSGGSENLPPSLCLGAGKEGEIWAELAVNSLKSFLLELKCAIMVPRAIIAVN